MLKIDAKTVDANSLKIDIDKVECVYVGKPNTCMCGCAGTYTYASQYQEQSGKRRGYKVDDEEVNDKKILRAIHKFEKCEDDVEIINDIKG
jgi:hypothetical protein